MTESVADLVLELISSRAMDPALVRADDGSLEIRSACLGIPRGYTVVIRQDELPSLDHSGTIDFENLSYEDAEALASCIDVESTDE